MLDAAQREVDALQAESASQAETFQSEKSRFHQALAVIEQSRVQASRVLAKDAVMLGVEIAHALAGKAFEVDHTQLIALMQTCLQEFSTDHPVQVRVSPADAQPIREHLEREGSTSIQVHPDPGLSAGDLTVEAEQLVIDSRLVERVQTLREELAATVRSDEPLEPDPEPQPEDEPDQ
jgi:flagellar biosynthesis/type III secretory pathway protein FliH